MENYIKVRGASTNNLKNVDVDIPINKITTVVGPSGSGKSSLVFHTLVTESKRRFLNSLPNDVKFFWNMPQSPKVDSIEPVLPVWALAQSNPIIGSRPNLSDLFGVFEHFQRFFYHHAHVVCPDHKIPLDKRNPWDDIARLIEEDESDDVIHFFTTKENYLDSYAESMMPARGYCVESASINSFDKDHDFFELFRLKKKDLSKLKKKVEELKLNVLKIFYCGKEKQEISEAILRESYSCSKCDFQVNQIHYELEELSPFNAAGACSECNGHGMNLVYSKEKIVKKENLSLSKGAVHMLEGNRFGYLKDDFLKECKKLKIDINKPFTELPKEKVWKLIKEGKGHFPGVDELISYLETKRYKSSVRIYLRGLQTEVLCESCQGTRVQKKSNNLLFKNKKNDITYGELLNLSVSQAHDTFKSFTNLLEEEKFKVIEILNILETAKSLGLGNVSLRKKAKKLTSSEYQRSLLVKILSYQGSGSLFVLDEPALGLSLEEQDKLIKCLNKIKDQGNTVLLVEHNNFIIKNSDHVIDIGPGAGKYGGEIISSKKCTKKLSKSKFKIEAILKSKSNIEFQADYYGKKKKFKLPDSGVSLIYGNEMAFKSKIVKEVVGNTLFHQASGEFLYSKDDIINLKSKKIFDDVIIIDSTTGKATSRSTVGTQLGLAPIMRQYFASLPVAKNLGLEKGHFSTNSDLGRCSTCEGKGINEVEMSFLEDIQVTCNDCNGKKLKPYLSNISDGEHTVWEAFNSPIEDVVGKLKLTPKYKKIVDYLELLNLSYLTLDRTISSLSGGERQRIKLINHLEKKIQNSLIIFENLSSGLSEKELATFEGIFQSLTERGNTIWMLDQNHFLGNFAENRLNFDM
ncbi:MAG: hypothetical protein GY909_12310 [Oligoflexia bacterium]|nr:hypothetical protein [Oligoflexia bacterium]